MFAGSPGSISRTICTKSSSPVFSPQSKEELKDAVDAYLEQFEVRDVNGGGDCLFQSVSVAESWADSGKQLDSSEIQQRARELRLMANDFLCPDGKPSGEALHGVPIDLIIEPRWFEDGCGYCARMRRDGQWGSAAEILALTRVLNRPITVYHRQDGRLRPLEEYGSDIAQQAMIKTPTIKSPLSVLYVSSVHYMALLPRKYGCYASLNGDASDCPYGPIGEWDVSRITDMSDMFSGTEVCHEDISKWDVSRVKDMSGMFRDARSFDGDLSEWDVSSVTDMRDMFQNAKAYNGDMSKWDVSRVVNMYAMFWGATLFNSDISKWDVSSVSATRERYKGMNDMFLGATSFKQNLCGAAWLSAKARNAAMFEGSSGTISPTECTETTTVAALDAEYAGTAINRMHNVREMGATASQLSCNTTHTHQHTFTRTNSTIIHLNM